jgi:hypothetical protein
MDRELGAGSASSVGSVDMMNMTFLADAVGFLSGLFVAMIFSSLSGLFVVMIFSSMMSSSYRDGNTLRFGYTTHISEPSGLYIRTLTSLRAANVRCQ